MPITQKSEEREFNIDFSHDEKSYTIKIKVKFKPTIGGDGFPQIASANILQK